MVSIPNESDIKSRYRLKTRWNVKGLIKVFGDIISKHQYFDDLRGRHFERRRGNNVRIMNENKKLEDRYEKGQKVLLRIGGQKVLFLKTKIAYVWK